ncbi:MAG: 16S rRNA (uracil(1498)-N(3))-methyltransferase [Omnitrophica WOR_2 bacterium GWA2_37_7]|nr:MAG: 16S rRNA (uracil(1498)-N(3))-methyltransferase [Omnitrophica WOR_2 bacterium GWA2_37_7]
MNLILLFEDDFVESGLVEIKGRRLDHVKQVIRTKVGEDLTVGIENGKIGKGKVTRIDDDILRMEVVLDIEPPPPIDITLVLALPRPSVLNRTLIAAASMGVKTFYLINARRVEKSFWLSPKVSQENIREQLILGLEQAKDTVMPKVIFKKGFKPFVEDELPQLIEGNQAILAHPVKGTVPLRGQTGTPVILVVGPEGGLIDYEAEMLKSIGFKPVSAGERILRVETIVPVLLSKLTS